MRLERIINEGITVAGCIGLDLVGDSLNFYKDWGVKTFVH